MVRIKREALEFALHAAQNTYPDEFIGLLRDNEQGEITHVLVLPRSVYGKGYSSIDFTMIPMFSHACGSVHSHPAPSNRPSRGDRMFFSKLGRVHIILAYPYREQDAMAYDQNGEALGLEIVD
ncbi:MAG: Mov34/MPN/PAD-1 family protein [Candidatus Micrarchaeota archaeon]